MRGLRTAALIDDALGLETTTHLKRYDSVRDALVAAVHAVHIPWTSVDTDALVQIKKELLRYDSVFTRSVGLLGGNV